MKRIKSLGVAAVLALMLAFTAGASSASADPSPGFFAQAYSSEVNGYSTPFHLAEFPGAGPYGTLNCSQPLELYDSNFTAATNALALDMKNGSCQAYFKTNVTLKANGCQLIARPGTSNRNDTVEIGPPGCGPMTTTGGYCQFSIPAQSGLAANIENAINVHTKKAYVQVQVTAGGIEYTTAGAGASCHNGTTYTNGTYSGGWDIGASLGANLIDLRVGGLGVAGKASEAPAEQPKLVAPEYPTGVAGEQSTSDPLVFGFKDGFTVGCKSSGFGGGVLSSAESAVGLDATYSGCRIDSPVVITTVAKMNSCSYELDVLNVGPPYSGSVDVECDTPGDKIELLGAACLFKIPAQQGLEGVTLENSAAVTGEVNADVHLTGVEYEAFDGFLCPLKGSGTFDNGTYDGSMLLSLDWS